MKPLRVGIIALETWGGGVAYTHNLIRALARLPEDERPHISLFYESKASLEKFQAILPCVDQAIAYRPWNARANSLRGIVFLQKAFLRATGWFLEEAALELALGARKANVQVMFPLVYAHSGYTPTPITWIPDFQHNDLPEMFSEADRQARTVTSTEILRRSKSIVFSSEHAQKQAERLAGKIRPRSSILRFTTVPETSWSGDPAPVQALYHLPDKYLIVCNQFWAHKDHKTLFKALGLLLKQGTPIHLVCTGGTNDPRNPDLYASLLAQVRADGLESYIHILGNVSRDEQMLLMNGATAVVQPSLYEGWSTVLEDARALNIPVVASDFPVHLEQNVPNALYFERGNAQDCAYAILEALKKEHPRSEQAHAMQEQQVLNFARTAMTIFESTLDGD